MPKYRHTMRLVVNVQNAAFTPRRYSESSTLLRSPVRLSWLVQASQAGLAGCCLLQILAENPCCCFTQQSNFWLS